MIYEECGRAGYDFDRLPSEDASTLRKMDAVMSQLLSQGVAVNYNFPAVFGQGKPSDAMGVPDSVLDTIAMMVALRVAPGMGKTMSVESRKALAEGKAFLFAETSKLPDMLLPKTTASGSGWYPWQIWFPFETDDWSDTITLGDLSLSDAACVAGQNYAATVGPLVGAQLSLIDATGRFTLVGSLVTATALPAGTYSFTVRQTFPGASNSPYDTVLTVTAS